MTDEEIIKGLDLACSSITGSFMWTANPFPILRDYIHRLQSENAALRERLEKTVELPCKIGDRFYVVNDCPPEIKEHECWAFTFTEDGQVLIIDGLDCDYSLKIVYLSKEDAEARLKGE